MCGRFILESTFELIAHEFGIRMTAINLKQSFNIAPSQNIHILINDGERRIATCRWGYIPSWAKDAAIGYKMINARAETITTKKSFRNAFLKRRCFIITDGFYEWRIKGAAKAPFFIRLKSGKPFGLAGLYNHWTSPQGQELCTCAIITTEANEMLQEIHNRMPVIIAKHRYDFWLDPSVNHEKELLSLLKPFPHEEMECYEVSPRVNIPTNNSPENIKPIPV
jgi:putative SOS response-associated peptidase YedK